VVTALPVITQDHLFIMAEVVAAELIVRTRLEATVAEATEESKTMV
jgi:hypothetical protein